MIINQIRWNSISKTNFVLQDIPELCGLGIVDEVPTVKYEKKRRPRRDTTHANENNALHNWQLKMMERKRQQGYISSK